MGVKNILNTKNLVIIILKKTRILHPGSKNSENKLLNSSKIEIYRPVQKYLSFGLSGVSVSALSNLILHENAVSGIVLLEEKGIGATFES